MTVTLGIVCALVAMLSWGIGDFMIQRSTRRIGDWETVFLISLVGVIVLAPFAASKSLSLINTSGSGLILLSIAAIVLFVAALLEFEALRRGKLAVVEPLWSSEILSSVLLAYLFLGERLSLLQGVSVLALIGGLIMVSFRGGKKFHHALFEKASLIALVSAIVMGGANFLFGVAARATDPLVTNFFVNCVLLAGSTIYLASKGKFRTLISDVARAPANYIGMTILDNAAWIAFAFAMVFAPIGIAVALSESYIIIAVILGIFMNRERLKWHQRLGLILALCAAILLATTL